MSAHAAGTPTQVAHPWRTVVRMFVVWGVGLLVAWIARTVGVDLTELSEAMADSLTVGVWAVASGAAQWLLTRPWVEALLQRSVKPLATGVHTEARPDLPG